MDGRLFFRKAAPYLLVGLFVLVTLKYGGIEPGSYLGNRIEFILGFAFIFLAILVFIVWPKIRNRLKGKSK
jgi:hypothetical protein